MLRSNARFRWATSRVIAHVPVAALRRALYELLFGYRLQGTGIGFGTVIDVASFQSEGARIGRFNRFSGDMSVRIGPDTLIGDRNTFVCADWAVRSDRFERSLSIGSKCLVTGFHLIDVTGRVAIGNGTWIAGCGTQIWTHGAGSDHARVTIGDNCYVGSAVRFAPGAEVGDRCLVAIGSVVVSKLDAPDSLIGGVPARIIKQPYIWNRAGTRSVI